MNSSSPQILSTLTHHAQKSKKKKSESQKTFDHLIHCCCRHNSLPAALALYGYLRERLMRNNRDKRGIGGGEEGGSVGGSVRGGVQGDEKVASTSTIASATESTSDSTSNTNTDVDIDENANANATNPPAAQLELYLYLTPPLTNPTLQSFASDPTIHMNSKIYSTLLSLCSGVSPSDYLSSGATNKPTDPTFSSNSEPVNNPTATSTYNWSSQILELYNTLPTSTSISFSSRYGFAKILQNDLSRHDFQLNEIGYTALIRVACKCGDEKNAVDLLRKAEEDKSVKKRNRMFFDVLCLKCTTPNVDIPYVFNLWKRMEIQGLKVREEEMMWSLRGCKDWGEVGGANYVVNTVGEEVFVPEEGMREAIVEWYKSKKRTYTPHSDIIKNAGLTFNGRLEPLATSHSNYEIVENLLSNISGLLPTGTQLKSVEISAGSCFNLVSMNEEIVVKGTVSGSGSAFCGGGKGKKRKHGAEEGQKRFQKWLNFKNKMEEHKFTHVIDGANVGYCNVNFAVSKHIDWEQVDSVVSSLVEMGGTPIVVLHERHFTHNMLPKRCRKIVENWDDKGILCRTPLQMNDDWFALHLCLVNGAKEGVEDSAVGLPFFVSNDELRDHRFMMLEARDLFRWKERKAVKFEFVGEPGSSERKPVFTFPRVYSERLQGREGGGICVPSKEGKWTEIKPV